MANHSSILATRIPWTVQKVIPFPYTINKNQLKMNQDLTFRAETLESLEENTEETFYDIGFGNDFDMTPKAQETKEKIN